MNLIVVLGLDLGIVEDADLVAVIDVALGHAVVLAIARVVLLTFSRLNDVLDLNFGLRSISVLDNDR